MREIGNRSRAEAYDRVMKSHDEHDQGERPRVPGESPALPVDTQYMPPALIELGSVSELTQGLGGAGIDFASEES